MRRTFNFPNEAAGIVQAGFFLKGGGLIELIGPIDSSDKENGFVKLMEERPEGFKSEPNPTAALSESREREAAVANRGGRWGQAPLAGRLAGCGGGADRGGRADSHNRPAALRPAQKRRDRLLRAAVPTKPRRDGHGRGGGVRDGGAQALG